MRILVRMPNWLGDAVMSTPALVNLIHHYPEAEVVLVGSPSVAELFRCDPTFLAVMADTSKTWRFRPAGIWQLASALRQAYGAFDLAVAFPNSISSRLLLKWSQCERRLGVSRGIRDLLLTDAVEVEAGAHQAEKYNQIVNRCLGTAYETGPTKLYVRHPFRYPQKTVGINPGAAYGSAKRWDPNGFAQVALELSSRFDVVLFGSRGEAALVNQITEILNRHKLTNVRNLAGETTIDQLLTMIAGLDLFITNDSGPMHIAGALRIPTVSIFGSTDHVQTCQWGNERSAIVRHDLPCAPCMKRTCPLQHHACMKEIGAQEVLGAVEQVASARDER